mmetsp:Transcript_989/g.2782  ORF Transcript_989/g.2782 Transcript_989/m.2782 type:complete len:664 (-) Transcript_989:562-2553(-)
MRPGGRLSQGTRGLSAGLHGLARVGLLVRLEPPEGLAWVSIRREDCTQQGGHGPVHAVGGRAREQGRGRMGIEGPEGAELLPAAAARDATEHRQRAIHGGRADVFVLGTIEEVRLVADVDVSQLVSVRGEVPADEAAHGEESPLGAVQLLRGGDGGDTEGYVCPRRILPPPPLVIHEGAHLGEPAVQSWRVGGEGVGVDHAQSLLVVGRHPPGPVHRLAHEEAHLRLGIDAGVPRGPAADHEAQVEAPPGQVRLAGSVDDGVAHRHARVLSRLDPPVNPGTGHPQGEAAGVGQGRAHPRDPLREVLAVHVGPLSREEVLHAAKRCCGLDRGLRAGGQLDAARLLLLGRLRGLRLRLARLVEKPGCPLEVVGEGDAGGRAHDGALVGEAGGADGLRERLSDDWRRIAAAEEVEGPGGASTRHAVGAVGVRHDPRATAVRGFPVLAQRLSVRGTRAQARRAHRDAAAGDGASVELLGQVQAAGLRDHPPVDLAHEPRLRPRVPGVVDDGVGRHGPTRRTGLGVTAAFGVPVKGAARRARLHDGEGGQEGVKTAVLLMGRGGQLDHVVHSGHARHGHLAWVRAKSVPVRVLRGVLRRLGHERHREAADGPRDAPDGLSHASLRGRWREDESCGRAARDATDALTPDGLHAVDPAAARGSQAVALGV